MAWNTITYACSHTEQRQLYGKQVDRDRILAAAALHDCPACRSAGSDLTGSPKQVAWAMDLRAKSLPKAIAAHADWSAKLDASPAPEAAKAHVQSALDAALDAICNRTAARDWIDSQSPEVEIYAAMRAAMLSAPKA